MDVADLAALAGVAAVILTPVWPLVRHVVTLVHEAGHVLAALATGRRVDALRLHRDSSGLTVSVGQPHGPGMVATTIAGPLAPTLLGLGGLALVETGRTTWAVAATVALLAVMLLFIRNLFGLMVLLIAVTVTYLVGWRTEPAVQEAVARAVVWLLLAGATRTAIESARRRTRGRGRSDAVVLSRLTRLPTVVWNLLLVLACGGALGVAAWWTLPVPS